jgi:hypothetical protein
MFLVKKITRCIAEKKCFESWTWPKCRCLAYIVVWMVGIPVSFVSLALIGEHYGF